MDKKIIITKKHSQKGEDGHKVVSVRMKEETISKLDILSMQTNRSRNELINILIESALENVEVTEKDK